MEDIYLFLYKYSISGEKVWFEKIYYHFAPKIYSYFYFKISDKQLAEDLTSEVFIKVYKNLKKKRFNSRSFKVWIYTVAKNTLIDYYRKNKKEKEKVTLTGEWENIEGQGLIESDFFIKNRSKLKSEFDFENYEIIEAINKLKKIQKDILAMMFLEDFDYKTIAEIYGKSQSTIRGIVMRALCNLRGDLINKKRTDKLG